MDYRNFTVSDFAADQYFIEWVLKPNAESMHFWAMWVKANPEKESIINEAKRVVLQFAHDEDEIFDWELDAVWHDIHQSMSDERTQPQSRRKSIDTRHYFKAAAVVLIVVASGVFLFTTRFAGSTASGDVAQQQITVMPENEVIALQHNASYATRYGEKRKVRLPDGSYATLNANSKIEIVSDWSSGPRLVVLHGEAFFNVTHKQDDQKFIVQTPGGLNVEVIGTEFNVSDRGSVDKVVLSSGKVRLYLGEGGIQNQMEMNPGELVEFVRETKALVKREVSTELYTSWKDNRLYFNDNSLDEIAVMLKDNYGYPVVFGDSTLADLRVTAALENVTLESILMTLSETLDVQIVRKKGQIVIAYDEP